ncbi:MAG: methyl-accepting chemotaxis protein [Lachnospiraceae bacterium]|nr:methyl-accepting chemotaxis protein [Lachnospiraceae bacterium]
MFKKKKLKDYVLLSFGIVIALAVFIAVSAIIGIILEKVGLDRLDKVDRAEAAAITCAQQANVGARYVREMVLVNDPQKIAELEAGCEECLAIINEKVAVFKETYGTKDGLAAQYESELDAWVATAQQIVGKIKAGDVNTAKEMLITECSPTLESLLNLTESICVKVKDQRNSTVKQSNIFSVIIIILNIIATIIAVFVSIMVSRQVAQNVNEAVGKIYDGVKELEKGNLHTSVDYEADNEFGDLATTMNTCFNVLKDYVESISSEMAQIAAGDFTVQGRDDFRGDFQEIGVSMQAMVSQMGSALQNVVDISEQVGSGSQQIASASEMLAEDATSQAGNVVEISQELENMHDKIEQTSDYMQEVSNLLETTSQAITDGHQKMTEMNEAMRKITERSAEIKNITHTINEISGQTNLLSLNAAIEAASAGEAGRGFAVVATEVGNLANLSAEAAKHIETLIEESILAIKEGNEKVQETSEALDRIIEGTGEITGKLGSVSEITKEQVGVVQNVQSNVDTLSGLAQNNAAASEETAATSEELSGQAIALVEVVEKFKLS